MHRHAGSVLIRDQRTPAVGQGFRQHRHHPIGEINRIAPFISSHIQPVARAHIPGHIGDGDQQMPSASIVLVPVGFRPHRVIEITGIGAVNGDQGDITEIVTALGRGRPCRFRQFEGVVTESGWQAVIGDGNHRGGGGAVTSVSGDTLDNSGPAQAQFPARHRLGADQFTGLRVQGVLVVDDKFPFRSSVRGAEPALATDNSKNPQDLIGGGGDGADNPGLISAVAGGAEARQHAVARAGLWLSARV